MILCRVFACQGAALKSSVRDRDSAPNVGRVLGSAVPEIAAEIVAVSAPMGLPTPTDLSTHARGPCWGSAWLVRRGWSGVVGPVWLVRCGWHEVGERLLPEADRRCFGFEEFCLLTVHSETVADVDVVSQCLDVGRDSSAGHVCHSSHDAEYLSAESLH